MFDEEPVKKTSKGFKSLEAMSIAEIDDYILELKAEIIKAEQNIEKKKASAAAADSVFKI